MKLEFIFPEKTTNEQKADFLLGLQSHGRSHGIIFYNEKININKIDEHSIFDNIRNWANEKGIIKKGDLKTQTLKLLEEAGELARSVLKSDHVEFKDAIGDCVVVLTNLAALTGLKIEDCINSAYEEIQSRTGKMENGTFIKD